MKLLLVNQPLNNRGDEAAHRALVRSLLAAVPTVDIRVLFFGVDEDSIRQFSVDDARIRYVHIKPGRGNVRLIKAAMQAGCLSSAFLLSSCRRLREQYRWADRVLCAPGGICMGGFQNWMHLFHLQLAIRERKPLDYFGRSIGPFPEKTWLNRRFRTVSRQILSDCSYVSLRDTVSETYARAWNIPFFPTIDSAFLEQPSASIPESVNSLIGSKYIVLVPNLLIWHYAYRDRLTRDRVCVFFAGVGKLLKKRFPSARLVLLPQTFNCGDTQGNDRPFFQEIASYGPDWVVLPDTLGSDVQQQIIRGASCVVGARYHSVVFAINNETPFVALSYEHKISGMLERLSLTDRMVDIRSLGQDRSVEEILEEIDRYLSLDLNPVSREKATSICRDALSHYLSMLC